MGNKDSQGQTERNLHNSFILFAKSLRKYWTKNVNFILQEFSDFLVPMLAFDPNQRVSAEECLTHPFLAGK